MSILSRRILCAAALVLSAGSTAGGQARQARILVLFGTPAGNPFHRAAAAALRSVTTPFGSRVALYEEFVDQAWFTGPLAGPATSESAFGRYLASKYKGTPFDVIFAVGTPALDFYERHGRPFFGKTPVIACIVPRARAERTPLDSLVTIVSDSASFSGTVSVALRLQPKAEQVVVVAGASALDQRYVRLLPEIRRVLRPGIRLTLFDGRSQVELERDLGALSRRSVILFISMTADSAGAHYDSGELERRLAAVASAPLYDWNNLSFGDGIVGGQLMQVDSSVIAAARLAIRVVAGERIQQLPRRLVNRADVMLDWRALDRWGIDARLAPPGARIMFRPETVWTRYRGSIVAVLIIITVQSVIIAALALQRARRQRAEASNRMLLDDLRQSYERIHHLAGQLITAQEAERARIGRELHDDINQKLAALSIALSRLRQRLPASAPALAESVTDLQDRTNALATDVRQLSHQLHSGVLQHAGLNAAVRALCLEFTRQHAIEVSFLPVGDVDAVAPDVALCLYRVAQEGLRNAATHSGAGRVGLTIARDDDAISMSLVDDGRGFDVERARRGAGLGLASLEERVRILNGTIHIRSNHGDGTEISLRIPPSRIPPSAFSSAHVAHHGTSR